MKNYFSYISLIFPLIILILFISNYEAAPTSNTSVNEVSFIQPTTTTSSTATSSTTTTILKTSSTSSTSTERVDINLNCKSLDLMQNNAKKGRALIEVAITNQRTNSFDGYILIQPGNTSIELERVQKALRAEFSKTFVYDVVALNVSGKNYFGAYVYEKGKSKVLADCRFDRKENSISATTTSTTAVNTTTTTTTIVDSFNTSTHILLSLTGLENNPHLCEIPGTGVLENFTKSYWGRCAPYFGNVPDYNNIYIPAWYNGESYTTTDPNWCYYDGEIIGCNVLRRIKTNQDINRTRELINQSIQNLNNLDNKNASSISPGYLSGCKVYKTSNKFEADYVVGITNSLNADYLVSVIGESLGTASCGIWYIQESTIGVDFTIAYVDRSLNPSLVVDFVPSKLELP